MNRSVLTCSGPALPCDPSPVHHDDRTSVTGPMHHSQAVSEQHGQLSAELRGPPLPRILRCCTYRHRAWSHAGSWLLLNIRQRAHWRHLDPDRPTSLSFAARGPSDPAGGGRQLPSAQPLIYRCLHKLHAPAHPAELPLPAASRRVSALHGLPEPFWTSRTGI